MLGKYYIINNSGVHSAVTRKALDHKLNISTNEAEYKYFGNDRVLLATQEDMTFLQDKKRLSMIPMERLYRKDNTTKLILIVTAVLSFLNLVQK